MAAGRTWLHPPSRSAIALRQPAPRPACKSARGAWSRRSRSPLSDARSWSDNGATGRITPLTRHGHKKRAAPFGTAPTGQKAKPLELGRNLVEGAAQLRADIAHRGNRGDGNEGRNQAVLNRGRALVAFDQLQKLDHPQSPFGSQ